MGESALRADAVAVAHDEHADEFGIGVSLDAAVKSSLKVWYEPYSLPSFKGAGAGPGADPNL